MMTTRGMKAHQFRHAKGRKPTYNGLGVLGLMLLACSFIEGLGGAVP